MTTKTKKKNIAQSIVCLKTTLEEVLAHMENEAVMIVDDDRKLCGLLTDGDIRRAFLTGANMDTMVSDIMTHSPLTINDGLSRDEKLSLMLGKQIRHLPIVDQDNRPVGLELLKDQYNESDFAEAILMAGGKGTRLRPLTYSIPKPLLNIGEKTILDNLLQNLKASGIHEVIISVNYLGDQIREHVDDGQEMGMNVAYIEEDKPLGTAGSLSLLDPRPERNFIVMNADLITELDFRSFNRFHQKSQNDISVCVRKVSQKVPYGVVALNSDLNTIVSIEEKPEYDYLVNAGIYMMKPSILDLIPENTFFDMVSLIKISIENGLKVGAFPVFEYWRDIGQHHEMREAQQEWSRQNNKVDASDSGINSTDRVR